MLEDGTERIILHLLTKDDQTGITQLSSIFFNHDDEYFWFKETKANGITTLNGWYFIYKGSDDNDCHNITFKKKD